MPVVPAPVVVRTWRGGRRQANLARLLAGCHIEDLDDAGARRAGALLGRANHSDPVDAVVVDSACWRNDTIVTSDPDDVRRLLGALGADLTVVVV